jgi:hypothetical protein
MVHVPEEGAPQEPAKTPTGQQPRKPTNQVPERDFSRMKTGPVQKPPGDKTPTRPGRKTQMLSLEPPKRRTGGAGREVRLDSFGGPRTLAQRNQAMMGKIGREKTGKIVRPPPSDGQLSLGMGKPAMKRSDVAKGMDLSGTNVNYGVNAPTSLLASGVSELTFVGYKADGVTTTTTPGDVQSVLCTVKVNLDRTNEPQRVLGIRVWLRAW